MSQVQIFATCKYWLSIKFHDFESNLYFTSTMFRREREREREKKLYKEACQMNSRICTLVYINLVTFLKCKISWWKRKSRKGEQAKQCNLREQNLYRRKFIFNVLKIFCWFEVMLWSLKFRPMFPFHTH